MSVTETEPTTRPGSVGTPVRRVEDGRLLQGQGTFSDDVYMRRQGFVHFVRSPHAHARIARIDTTAAKASPGVVAVFTGADLAKENVGGLPCGWLIHSIDGSPMREPPHPVIAHDKVRHVGDQVALVIAESVRPRRTPPN